MKSTTKKSTTTTSLSANRMKSGDITENQQKYEKIVSNTEKEDT